LVEEFVHLLLKILIVHHLVYGIFDVGGISATAYTVTRMMGVSFRAHRVVWMTVFIHAN
jgi:hypothetical protein